MRQAFQTFRYAVFTALLMLALFLTPFDFISNAQSSGEQEVQTMASALDKNQNRVLDDSEILNAIQLWILGDSASGDDTVINDAFILSLVQLWITGESISSPLLMGDDDGTAERTDDENAADSVVRDKMYWSSANRIYRCELANCMNTESVFLTLNVKFGWLWALTSTDTNLYWIATEVKTFESKCEEPEPGEPISQCEPEEFYQWVVGTVQTCEIANCSATVTDLTVLGDSVSFGDFLHVKPYWTLLVKDTYVYVNDTEGHLHCVTTTSPGGCFGDLDAGSFFRGKYLQGLTFGP